MLHGRHASGHRAGQLSLARSGGALELCNSRHDGLHVGGLALVVDLEVRCQQRLRTLRGNLLADALGLAHRPLQRRPRRLQLRLSLALKRNELPPLLVEAALDAFEADLQRRLLRRAEFSVFLQDGLQRSLRRLHSQPLLGLLGGGTVPAGRPALEALALQGAHALLDGRLLGRVAPQLVPDQFELPLRLRELVARRGRQVARLGRLVRQLAGAHGFHPSYGHLGRTHALLLPLDVCCQGSCLAYLR
mmetsp:Transcript_55242/g.147937  ORF Transcript_55242/g.147937 Transcript_55242/m.147937 type:complete len:247 (-) Transcript_55242:384-1124(-)